MFFSDLWQENRQLSEHLEQMHKLLEIADSELQAQRDAASVLGRKLESDKELVRQERESLMAKLSSLEADDQTSADEIRLVQAELQQTRLKLEQYDPVRLEEEERTSRRTRLEAVLKAVVFVEKKIVYRHRKSGKLIHLETDAYGNVLINWEDRGELLAREGGGSGFCVSEDGWIVTNAHVVEEPEIDAETTAAVREDKDAGESPDNFAVDPVVELEVVFSGSSLRHPATVVKMVSDGDQDLALLKVDVFAGLSSVPIFDPSYHGPEAGSEVWLFGFPLGKSIPQEGELLTASVFRGIVSRKVDPYLQVQAVVYPGNSGGPAVDEVGRFIGIVTAVQTTPDGQIASDIGYVIPVGAAIDIWPPESP
jgi:S1-C subfamily serine protease